MPTYRFVQWEDGSTNSTRTINLITDMAITAIYEEVTFPSPQMCPTAVIATAIYGPSIELKIIRRFRDNFMAQNSVGRWLSRAYYYIGKYVAKILLNKKTTKIFLKGYLDLAIKVLKRRF